MNLLTQGDQEELSIAFQVEKFGGENGVGAIAGTKTGYGTQHIENCYWTKELSLDCLGMTSENVQITNSQQYETTYLKSQEFLDILNYYVEEYNKTDKSFSKSEELLKWKFDESTGFPTLEFY